MQQPREERRMKREKKRYFLTKMIKKVPKGHLFSSLFTFLSSLKGGVANICNTPLGIHNHFYFSTVTIFPLPALTDRRKNHGQTAKRLLLQLKAAADFPGGLGPPVGAEPVGPGSLPALPVHLPVPYSPVRLCVGAVSQGQRRMPAAASADAPSVHPLSGRRRGPGTGPMAHPLVDFVVSSEPVLLAHSFRPVSEISPGKMVDPGSFRRRRLCGRTNPLGGTALFSQPDPRLLPLVLAGRDFEAESPLAPATASRTDAPASAHSPHFRRGFVPGRPL